MLYTIKGEKGSIIKGYIHEYTSSLSPQVKGNISIVNPKNYSQDFVRSLRINKNGKVYFTWNKEIFFIKNYKAYTPQTLVKRISEGKEVFAEDLCQTLQKYGMGSLRLIIEDSDSKERNVYKFSPEYLCMPEDNYKLKIVPLKRSWSVGEHRKYVSDLVSLLTCNCGYYLIPTEK